MTSKLFFSKNCIEVHGDASQLFGIYPMHSNRSKTIHKLSIRYAPEVLKLMRNLDATNIDTAPLAIQEFYYKEILRRENIVDLNLNGPRKSCVVNDNLTLRTHQQLGREIAEYYDRYAFFYDTRTGKTPLSLAIIDDDIKANPTHKWLVVCPLILIDNAWIEDAAVFMPHLKFVSLHATTKKKRLEQFVKDANVYVVNTEAFVGYGEEIAKLSIQGMFVDESSDLKSTKSKVSKAVVDYAQTVDRFYLLSGTPAPNGEHEYYMQIKSVDYYGTPQSYAQFKEHYFYNASYNPQFEKLKLRGDKQEEFLAWVKRYASFIDQTVLDTPGRTFNEYEFDMPPDLKKHYNKLKNELYLEVEDKQILAPSAAAKLNKLNQVTSGFVIDTQAVKENKFYDTANTEVYVLDSYRFDILYKLLKSLGTEQVLIWCNYRKEFDMIKNVLKESCRCVYGGTSLAEKNEAIQLFKAGKVQYLIANPASADKGLTLTNCHIAIYFSLNWSYELFKQSAERIYGDVSKQPKHCQYYVFIAKGTIDRVLYSDVLQGKGAASKAILNHLKPKEDLKW